jgi:hypothetical protein
LPIYARLVHSASTRRSFFGSRHDVYQEFEMSHLSTRRRAVRVAAIRGIAALACGGTLSLAQAQAPGSVRIELAPTLEASAPGTPVPKAQYQSSFDGLPTGIEQAVVDWRAANATVGQFKRGHVDLLKWEEEQVRQKPVPSGMPDMPCCKGTKP